MASIDSLSSLMVSYKLFSKQKIEQLHAQLPKETSLSCFVLEQSLIDEQSLLRFFSKAYSLAIVDLGASRCNFDLLEKVPESIMSKNLFAPIAQDADAVLVAVFDPSDEELKETIKFYFQKNIELVVSSYSQITRHLNDYLKRVELKKNSQTEESSFASSKEMNACISHLISQGVIYGFSKMQVSILPNVDAQIVLIDKFGQNKKKALSKRIAVGFYEYLKKISKCVGSKGVIVYRDSAQKDYKFDLFFVEEEDLKKIFIVPNRVFKAGAA